MLANTLTNFENTLFFDNVLANFDHLSSKLVNVLANFDNVSSKLVSMLADLDNVSS